MLSQFSLLALGLAAGAYAQSAGSFSEKGDTLVSAMMVNCRFETGSSCVLKALQMFIGNAEKVYILDKTEGNSNQINGHPAWGSVWFVQSRLVYRHC